MAPLPRPRGLPAGDGGEVETGLGRAVADAGHVHHRVSHRDRPLGVHQALRLTVEPLDHLHVAELGKEAVHGVIELEQTPLVQREERDAGNGLGHRVEPPDGVVENRARPFAIHQAERAVVRDLIRAGDDDLAAGELPGSRYRVRRCSSIRSSRLPSNPAASGLIFTALPGWAARVAADTTSLVMGCRRLRHPLLATLRREPVEAAYHEVHIDFLEEAAASRSGAHPMGEHRVDAGQEDTYGSSSSGMALSLAFGRSRLRRLGGLASRDG